MDRLGSDPEVHERRQHDPGDEGDAIRVGSRVTLLVLSAENACPDRVVMSDDDPFTVAGLDEPADQEARVSLDRWARRSMSRR